MSTRIGELLGRAGGALLAPWTAAISAVRGARMFHPRGIALRAEVRPLAMDAPFDRIAQRIRGPALVRLSSAWWKVHEWKDVLGVAIRFTRATTPSARPTPGDQDLLFATIRRPWTIPFAPITTQARDFFANAYYAVAPFEVDTAGTIEWRLMPAGGAIESGASREEKLSIALEERRARFVLEARPYRRVIDIARHRPWLPVAEVRLLEVVEIDDHALRFDPFRAGRGIVPTGFVHALRRAAYGASQWGRGRVAPSPVVDLEAARARRAANGQRAHA